MQTRVAANAQAMKRWLGKAETALGNHSDRLNAINQHFITAFLDRHLKGDESRAANLRAPYAGFQPRWSIGFDLEAAAAQGR